jgi:hypothetical protein
MTKVDLKSLKEKIVERLKKNSIANPEVILVTGGCLVQVIGQVDPQKIFETLTKLHQELPKEETSFPYKIYVYSDANEAFKVDVGFKTRLHDYASGHHTTYLTSQDGIGKMREVDVDALLYGEFRPFEFRVQSKPATEFFGLDKNIHYKELDVGGGHYDLENAKLEQISNTEWKVTLL